MLSTKKKKKIITTPSLAAGQKSEEEHGWGRFIIYKTVDDDNITGCRIYNAFDFFFAPRSVLFRMRALRARPRPYLGSCHAFRIYI